jgi:hypothetical protein
MENVSRGRVTVSQATAPHVQVATAHNATATVSRGLAMRVQAEIAPSAITKQTR